MLLDLPGYWAILPPRERLLVRQSDESRPYELNTSYDRILRLTADEERGTTLRHGSYEKLVLHSKRLKAAKVVTPSIARVISLVANLGGEVPMSMRA